MAAALDKGIELLKVLIRDKRRQKKLSKNYKRQDWKNSAAEGTNPRLLLILLWLQHVKIL